MEAREGIKRPWRMEDYPPFTDHSARVIRTYSTLDIALAKAIIRCMGRPIGEKRLIQNYATMEFWLVRHISGYRVLVKKMKWGPDDKWMME